MNKKQKILRWCSSLAIIAPITVAISCSEDFPTLTAKGSSTVLPFMQSFASEYDYAEVQVAGGGSGAGQKAIIDGSVDFGNMSATPDSPQIINSNKFRTVTVGIDGLAIVAKGRTNDNAVNIQDLLTLFTSKQNNSEWLKSATNIFGVNITSSSEVEVLSRENPEKSGTAEIFGIGLGSLSGTGTTKISHHPTKFELIGVTSTTGEANKDAFRLLEGTKKKYAITYLSLGVADVLMEGKKDFSKIKITNGTKTMNPLKSNVGGSYRWARPLNIIYNTQSNNKAVIVKFVQAMLEEGQDYLPKSGYLKLTKKQLIDEGIQKIDSTELYETNKQNSRNGLNIKIIW